MAERKHTDDRRRSDDRRRAPRAPENENAENILVLTDDGIAEAGTHQELLDKGGIYEKLYHMHR